MSNSMIPVSTIIVPSESSTKARSKALFPGGGMENSHEQTTKYSKQCRKMAFIDQFV